MYSRTWLFWQIIRAHIKGDGCPAAAHAHRKTDMATPLLGCMIDLIYNFEAQSSKSGCGGGIRPMRGVEDYCCYGR